MKKLALTIGIPAYNEEKNIANLLKDIASQKLVSARIKYTVVLSDKSTDSTDVIVKSFKKVTLSRNVTRLGKSGSIKKFFASYKNKTDVLIIIDADTRLAGKNTIEKLVAPFTKDDTLFAASGHVIPRKPHTLIEKVGYFNTILFDQIIKESKKNTDYYLSTDQLMSVRTKHFTLHDFQGESMYDEFYFLLAMKKHLKFVSVKNAVSYYRLPATFSDYVTQMVRFLASPANSEANFGEDFVKQYQTITLRDKLIALFKLFMKAPRISLLYFSLQIWSKVVKLLSRQKMASSWSPIASTK